MRTECLGLAAAGLLLLCCGAARAQTGFNVTGAQTANQQALQGYRWTSRTEVKVNGELVLFTLSLARLDSHGRIQLDKIGGGEKSPSHDVLQPQHSRAEFKMNALEAKVLEVAAQVRKYDAPVEKQLEAFRRDARRAQGSGDPTDTEQWVMQGLLRPDDQVTLWVDRQSGLQRRMEISGRGGSQAFTVVTTFAPIQGGPWALVRRVIDIPGLKVQMVTENSDHAGSVRLAQPPTRL
jgi:hypothetical protein